VSLWKERKKTLSLSKEEQRSFGEIAKG